MAKRAMRKSKSNNDSGKEVREIDGEKMYKFEKSVLKQMEDAGMTRGEAKLFAKRLEQRIKENEMAIENDKPFVLYSRKKD